MEPITVIAAGIAIAAYLKSRQTDKVLPEPEDDETPEFIKLFNQNTIKLNNSLVFIEENATGVTITGGTGTGKPNKLFSSFHKHNKKMLQQSYIDVTASNQIADDGLLFLFDPMISGEFSQNNTKGFIESGFHHSYDKQIQFDINKYSGVKESCTSIGKKLIEPLRNIQLGLSVNAKALNAIGSNPLKIPTQRKLWAFDLLRSGLTIPVLPTNFEIEGQNREQYVAILTLFWQFRNKKTMFTPEVQEVFKVFNEMIKVYDRLFGVCLSAGSCCFNDPRITYVSPKQPLISDKIRFWVNVHKVLIRLGITFAPDSIIVRFKDGTYVKMNDFYYVPDPIKTEKYYHKYGDYFRLAVYGKSFYEKMFGMLNDPKKLLMIMMSHKAKIEFLYDMVDGSRKDDAGGK